VTCVDCATEIGPSRLSCPTCHRLVYAERLKELAAEAAQAKAHDDISGEVTAWRQALELLPPDSSQHQTIEARVEALGARLMDPSPVMPGRVGARAAPAAAPQSRRNLTIGGTVSAVGLVLLTKGKLLLLGLTNATTLLTIIPALGVYWVAFGWGLAAGLIASIYVHEMGHVFALTRFGIAASAPMFLPGLGAVIRSRLHRIQPKEEARVGIAGPIWGLGAAAVAFAINGVTHSPIWLAIGHVGAWINLFNLVPVWQLDGARAFRAMNRPERWAITLLIAATFLITREGLLVLLALASGARALSHVDWPAGDRTIAIQFALLIITLSAMSAMSAH
jgi:Zn-dependent protease